MRLPAADVWWHDVLFGRRGSSDDVISYDDAVESLRAGDRSSGWIRSLLQPTRGGADATGPGLRSRFQQVDQQQLLVREPRSGAVGPVEADPVTGSDGQDSKHRRRAIYADADRAVAYR